jgi:hypothetical protein
MNAKRPKIGEMLVKAGAITNEQLEEALADQRNLGGRLASILFDKCKINERQFLDTLKSQLGLPAIDLTGVRIEEKALKLVPYELGTKYGVLSYGTKPPDGKGSKVLLAMADPTDLAALDELSAKTGLRFEPMLALDSVIRYILNDYFIINNAHGDYVLDPDVKTNFCGPESKMVYELENQREMKVPLTADISREEAFAMRDGGEEYARQFRRPSPSAGLAGEIPEVRALVDLLVSKGLITEDEYRRALGTKHQ